MLLSAFIALVAFAAIRFVICWAKDANPQPIRVEDQRDIGRRWRNRNS